MLAVANRRYDKIHEGREWHDGTETIWAEEFSNLTPWHYRDGVTIYLAETDENPDDDFLDESTELKHSDGQDP